MGCGKLCYRNGQLKQDSVNLSLEWRDLSLYTGLNINADFLKKETIKVAGIIPECVVNGPGGISFTIFAQGCKHRCEGCHNPGTHDFNTGIIYTLDQIIKELDKYPLSNVVTFTGGDPFFQASSFKHLAGYLKDKDYKLVGYTGFYFEEFFDKYKDKNMFEFLKELDLIIDGPFIKQNKDPGLKFRGSTNQRIIKVHESIKSRKAVLDDKYM